jgi:hypothetical protein
MKLTTTEQSNYLAKVVRLSNQKKHSNADKLLCWNIDFNNVITDLSYKEGDVCVVFPTGCTINKDLIAYLNAFQDKELNNNKELKGYFNSKGVVKATNLRGEKSEGFLIRFDVLYDFVLNHLKQERLIYNTLDINSSVDKEFDTIEGIRLCEKYEPIVQAVSKNEDKQPKQKVKLKDLMIEGQFKFHDETKHLKKNIDKLNLNDEIVITSKLHGSSAILSNVLVKRKLSWIEKLAKRIGIKVVESEFGYIYSSGKPKGLQIKGIDSKWANNGKDYYSTNIWKQANDDFKQCIEPGITLYGELVGSHVQKSFDYTKLHNKEGYGFLIYRITRTNSEGFIDEFSWNQIETYCEKYGFKTVPMLFRGKAIDFELQGRENLIETLSYLYLEKDCFYSTNKVPDEGICVRIEKPFQVYKLKSHRFTMKENEQETVNES